MALKTMPKNCAKKLPNMQYLRLHFIFYADFLFKELAIPLVATTLILILLVPSSQAFSDDSTSRLYPDNLFGAAYLSGPVAIATGYYGAVRVSSDGGTTWLAADSGTTDLIRRVAAVPGGASFAVSHRGRILESDAGGRDWRVIHEEAGLYLRDISFSDARNGFAVG
ncbi:WD40/YVTN/BNR-like repeat-containing protein, partial [Zavarzinia sp.]|uniref:WD40/YVTN/BNR-like repeat-containing protein n=1 Tax=Zavarzinia sp. TaxID=2027920 RepID=UPI0035654052